MSTIENRMEDCGNGRHVGWWLYDAGHIHQALLIEIQPETMLISCCEGPRGDKRISFVVGRQQAIEITHALMKALGIAAAEADQSP